MSVTIITREVMLVTGEVILVTCSFIRNNGGEIPGQGAVGAS